MDIIFSVLPFFVIIGIAFLIFFKKREKYTPQNTTFPSDDSVTLDKTKSIQINPASGLPMINGTALDVMGNVYGESKH